MILLDVFLPDMDGYEVAQALRSSEETRHIPFIFLTSKIDPEIEARGLSLGAADFLTKPFSRELLLRRIWLHLQLEKYRKGGQAGDEPGYPLTPDASTVNTAVNTAVYNERSVKARLAREKIEGLDIAGGVKRFDGDEEVYLPVIRAYARNTPQLLETARTVTEASLPDYAITVHGVKGSSRGILADRVADLAEALERAAKAGDFGYVETHNASFIEAASQLASDIGGMLARLDAERPKSGKDKPDEKALAGLRDACLRHDMDGIDAIVAELTAFEYESGGELIDWLRDNAELMKYTEMAERLTGGVA